MFRLCVIALGLAITATPALADRLYVIDGDTVRLVGDDGTEENIRTKPYSPPPTARLSASSRP